MEGILNQLTTMSWPELARRAGDAVLASKGTHVNVRGLIEFSNICQRNCLYCGLRAQNRKVRRYRLDPREIIKAALEAAEAGVDTIVLQSGEGACEANWLASLVQDVRNETGLPVTLSVGERPEADYELWRKAGADRYLIKHETSDSALYERLHPGYTLRQRLDALRSLRELGYETGSGFMIGLPGQTLESLASDIALCRDLHVEMCGAGPFIAHKDTPLAHYPSGSPELTLRVLAALRLAMPWANLPATTALATVDPKSGQTKGLCAGANVLMPGFTPAAYSKSYTLYDNKNRVSILNAASSIEAAGRTHRLKTMSQPSDCKGRGTN